MTEETRRHASPEMAKLGLIIDSLQIRVVDPTGYIDEAEALARESEAVIGQQIAERLPEIVEASAKALGNVEHLTVLNGAQGLAEVMSQVVGQGTALYRVARELTTEPRENGKVPARRTPRQSTESSCAGSPDPASGRRPAAARWRASSPDPASAHAPGRRRWPAGGRAAPTRRRPRRRGGRRPG